MKKLIILAFALAILTTGCATLAPDSNQYAWDKHKDVPGLLYRAYCEGKSFEGSKFYKWEVRVKNHYCYPADFSVAIYDHSDTRKSERYTLKLTPGDMRKVTFYSVEIPGSAPHKVVFSDVIL